MDEPDTAGRGPRHRRRPDIVMPFYDMDGNCITATEWARLFEDLEGRTFGYDELLLAGGTTARVITVWVGIDDDRARIFSTAVDVGRGYRPARYYGTKADAIAGHAAVVGTLQHAAIADARTERMFTRAAKLERLTSTAADLGATSGGVELTDDVMQRMADEAEQGYDVSRLHTRGDNRGGGHGQDG